jgi:hypothetical protein
MELDRRRARPVSTGPDQPSSRGGPASYPSPSRLPILTADWAVIIQRYEQNSSALFLAGVIAVGRLLAVAASRYHRTWQSWAGSASSSQTISTPPELGTRVPAQGGYGSADPDGMVGSRDAGVVVDPDVESIASGLRAIGSMRTDELQARRRARALLD